MPRRNVLILSLSKDARPSCNTRNGFRFSPQGGSEKKAERDIARATQAVRFSVSARPPHSLHEPS
jgi:hypothetical protein